MKPETDDILALAGRFERQADSIDKLIESLGNGAGSHSSVVINAGAGVIGACVAVAGLSLVAMCFVGSLWWSQGHRLEKLEQEQTMHDIRIRKNSEKVEVLSK